jgi:hypothetical protein
MQKIISLELNEVNFDFVQEYCARGELPTFKRMLGNYQLFETVAEKSYPQLEPSSAWEIFATRITTRSGSSSSPTALALGP